MPYEGVPNLVLYITMLNTQIQTFTSIFIRKQNENMDKCRKMTQNKTKWEDGRQLGDSMLI